MDSVPCPKCNHPNPPDAETCMNCGTPLKSAAMDSIRPGEEPVKKVTAALDRVSTPTGKPSIHPGELPTKKDTGELERALPTWLQTVRKGDEPQAGQQQNGSAADAGTGAEEDAQKPDWLSGMPRDEENAEEIPDWLSALNQQKEDADKEEEVPDWLAGIRTRVGDEEEKPSAEESLPLPEEGQTAPPAADEPAEGIEQWLKELDQGANQVPAPAATDGVEWILRSEEEASATEADSEATPTEIPDWLGRIASVPAPEDGLESSEPPQDIAPEAPAAEQPSASSDAAITSLFDDNIPDWISSLEVEKTPKPPVAAFPPGAGLSDEDENIAPAEDLPEWLAGVQPSGSASGETPALIQDQNLDASPKEATGAFPMEAQPDWLSSLKPEGAERAIAAEEQEDADKGSLEKVELPSWVQAMRPVEAVVEQAFVEPLEQTDQTIEDGGPLAGLRGVLPAVPSLGALQKPPAYSIKLQVDENQQQHAAQLEQIITNEPEPGFLVNPKAIFSARLLRWVIAAVLLVVIGVTIASGINVVPAQTLYPPEMIGAMQITAGLEANSPVLVVFDYQPALSGEMEAAAESLIDHVLYSGARLTLLSTLPTGPALAERFLDNTQAEHNYQAGLQYINLGYLSGGPAGMLDFAQSPQLAAPLGTDGQPAWGTPPLAGIQTISDYAVVIILTDDSDVGRTWVEQTSNILGDTPLLMVISAQAEPMIRPYYDSGQIQGLVTGLVGGKGYEDAIQVSGAANRYWNAFSTAMLAAIIMISAGAVWSAILTWRERHPRQEVKA